MNREEESLVKLSDRMYEMSFSATRKLIPYAEKAKREGKRIYHLNIGQPDIPTPQKFFEAVGNFQSRILAYGDSNGDKALIDSMRGYYREKGIDFEKDEILVTNGGSEALRFALLATCNPGDAVLLPEPFYTDYYALAKELNLHIIPLTTRAEKGYHLPEKGEILSLIGERTKAILINNPNNPTGTVYTPDEIAMVAEIAGERGLYIISDEVYREFVYGDTPLKSFSDFSKIRDQLMIVDSISKRYSACGARIGCIASKNREMIYHMQKLCQVRICPPTLEQIGAAELYKIDVAYLREVNEDYRKRRDVVFEALQKMEGVVCEKPEGAFYVAAKLPVDNAEKFIIWMLEDFDADGETILLSPLEGFYATEGLGEREVRIAYVLRPEILLHCMRILKQALDAYPGRLS